MAIDKIITPEFRVSFPVVFKPVAFTDANGVQQEPKYSMTMLFDKKTDLKDLKALVVKAGRAKWPEFDAWLKEKKPDGTPKIRLPFRDGDANPLEGYKGTVYCSASSKLRPGLVDNNRQPILNAEQFYAGCYARAELTAYAYDVKGNRGVALGLQNIQFLRDGQPFSGRSKAEDVFDAVGGGENPSDYSGEYDVLAS